jgi:N-acetylneuraminic acid mutarotase
MPYPKPDFSFLFIFFLMAQLVYAQSTVTIRNLAPIPDGDGFAGSLAGVSHGALLVAGGSNFPDGGRPWNGGTKKWYDQIFVLEKPSGKWKMAGNLPRPLGYAVSVTWRDAVVCVGGSNADGHVADSFLMRWHRKKITFEPLPDFPMPLANACGALIGDVLYVAGGLEKPTDTQALHTFYALDLAAKPAERTWKLLPAWQGEGRMLSVAAVRNGKFFLFSGTQLRYQSDDQSVSRSYLKDAHCFDPALNRWTRQADLPHATVAAPGPAIPLDNQIIILGGDTGENAAAGLSLQDKHPGFSTEFLAYDPSENSWRSLQYFQADLRPNAETHPNESTYWPVTTPAVPWRGGYVIPGGEVRPGTRTPRVLMIELK